MLNETFSAIFKHFFRRISWNWNFALIGAERRSLLKNSSYNFPLAWLTSAYCNKNLWVINPSKSHFSIFGFVVKFLSTICMCNDLTLIRWFGQDSIFASIEAEIIIKTLGFLHYLTRAPVRSLFWRKNSYLNFRAKTMKRIEVFFKLFEFSRQNNFKIFEVFVKLFELSSQNNETNWSYFQFILIFAPKYWNDLKCFSNYFFRAKIFEVIVKSFEFSRQINDTNWSVFQFIWIFVLKIF